MGRPIAAPGRARGREAGAGALAAEVTLELCDGREGVEDEATAWRGGVDALGE
ncbi:hypothetical protein [Tsukamurella paurometabola]|uniref:hypothetical protein n=1 Tax=Tsukamurella paurometabola TaxID=2061 RepID=UPI003CCFE7C9